jgi:hypothetical protein
MNYPAPRDGLATAECTLEHVRCLLAEPECWQRAGPAHDRRGQFAAPDAPEAAAWSLSGALERLALTGIPGFGDHLTLALATVALSSAVAHVCPDAPAWWRFGQFEQHPDTTHADVLALLDEAIALLQRS